MDDQNSVKQQHVQLPIAIFASGAGSNAEALIQFSGSDESYYSVQTILTNKEYAGIHEVAHRYGIPIEVLSDSKNASFILGLLQKHAVKVIALAGYLKLLPSEVVQAFPGRIMNIHPSLLPEYGGHGMYGNKVHMAVLQDKKPYTGVTVHLVDEQYDTGSALCQSKVSIVDCETVEDVAQKVKNIEHEIYPLMLNQLCKTIYAQE